MRFAMTARTIAQERDEGRASNEMTARNIDKVTRFRQDGPVELEAMVKKIRDLKFGERDNAVSEEKRWGGKV
jgi:large subunit ribosomal protein L17